MSTENSLLPPIIPLLDFPDPTKMDWIGLDPVIVPDLSWVQAVPLRIHPVQEFQAPFVAELNLSLIPARINKEKALRILWPDRRKRRWAMAMQLNSFHRWLFWTGVALADGLEAWFPDNRFLKSLHRNHE